MIQLGSPGVNNCTVYNYYSSLSNATSCATPAQSTGNNGNAMGYFYSDPYLGHSAAYTYDSLNRLATSCTTAGASCSTSGSPRYNLTYGYDRYGNTTCVLNSATNGPCPQWAYDTTTNRVANGGFTFDAAGNMTQDGTGFGTHTYQWDAENRLRSVDSGATATYIYNALGQRVEKGVSCLPWTAATCEEVYDAFGNLAMITRTNGGALVIYVPPVAGRQFAEYCCGYTWFSHTNALGSVGTVTNQAGALLQGEIYYPWGYTWATSGSVFWERFASMPKVRDAETGLDPATNRMMSSRWHSPDPLAGDVTNPQSLNRYAYVLNNPINLTDVLGLGPPCGGMGQMSCEQYFSPIGQATGPCPAEFSQCYATLGGTTIGISGSSATAFTFQASGQSVDGGSCNPEAGPCTPAGINIVTTWTVQPGPGGWGLAWVPGLAPGANGLLQAVKQQTTGLPKTSPGPKLSPPSQPVNPMDKLLNEIENSPIARGFRAINEFFGDTPFFGGSPPFFLIPIVHPCIFLQGSPACGGPAFPTGPM